MTDELLLNFEDDPTPQNLFECPGPGIYKSSQVSFETYAGWRAVNSGVIKSGIISPKHFAAALEGRIKTEDTKDRKLGRANHCLLLEPGDFNDRFIVAGKCEAVIKTGARKGSPCGHDAKYLIDETWYCGTHGEADRAMGGKDLLSQDEYRRALGVVNALKNLPDEIKPMLAREGWNEASIVWEHKGLKLKGRLDRYSAGKRPVIIDVKKMQVGKGRREDCQKAIFNYGYHIQAAIYVKGIEFLEGKRPEFIWLFHEDNDPFDMQIIPATDEDIDIGWRACDLAIQNYIDSMPNHWGYIRIAENVKPGGLPPWVIEREREKYNV